MAYTHLGRPRGSSRPSGGSPESLRASAETSQHTSSLDQVSIYQPGLKRSGVVTEVQTHLNIRSSPSNSAKIHIPAHPDLKPSNPYHLTQGQKIEYHLLKDAPKWAYIMYDSPKFGPIRGYAAMENAAGDIRIREIGQAGLDSWMQPQAGGYVPTQIREQQVAQQQILAAQMQAPNLPTSSGALPGLDSTMPWVAGGAAISFGVMILAILAKKKGQKRK